MKKALRFILISVLAILLGVLAAASAGFFVMEKQAYADEPTLAWNAVIAKKSDNVGYIPLPTDVRITDANELFLLISGFQSNESFRYLLSETQLLTEAELDDDKLRTDWISMVREASTVKSITINGVTDTYIENQIDAPNNYDRYIYFRREYGGSQREYFQTSDGSPVSWHIRVNTTVKPADLEIVSVTARYLASGGSYAPYTGAAWIAKDLEFTVTTLLMSKDSAGRFNPLDEILWYSLDDTKSKESPEKIWRRMTSNIETVSETVNDKPIVFRVTDMAGNSPKYYNYAYNVKIDKGKPTFDLSQFTKNENNEIVPYSVGSWTAAEVIFYISKASTNNCVSPVTYFAEVNNTGFSQIGASGGSFNGINYVAQYPVGIERRGTTSIRFRAVTEAGESITTSQSITVNIDTYDPSIRITATTIDPDDINNKATKNLNVRAGANANTFIADKANGSATIEVYNKNNQGFVQNESAVTFFMSTNGEDGNYSPMTSKIQPDKNNKYEYWYTLSDKINSGAQVTKTYWFYLRTEAGKTTEKVSLTIIYVADEFDIAAYTTPFPSPSDYRPNASGWVNTPITVYVKVPSDSVKVGTAFTVPTTTYTFIYSPIGLDEVYPEAVGEYVLTIEDGLSVYSFKLSASAEANFTVRARNGAGKLSKKSLTTELIRIEDVLDPNRIKISAAVLPEVENYTNVLTVASGQWVSGSVVITLEVKDGVSGIIVKRLEKMKNATGDTQFDGQGRPILIEVETLRSVGTVSKTDGVWYVYSITVSVPNADMYTYTEEYKFRVYTGSGISTEPTGDIPWLVKLENPDKVKNLLKLNYISVNGEYTAVNSASVTLSPICKNTTLTLFTSQYLSDHFDWFPFGSQNSSTLRNGDKIFITVGENVKGEQVIRFFLKSQAVNYLGQYLESESVYTITVPYNTLNLTTNIELNVSNTDIDNGTWTTQPIIIDVWLASGTSDIPLVLTAQEKATYKYYYMLIPHGSSFSANTWIYVPTLSSADWLSSNDHAGMYSTINGREVYRVRLPFFESSFYGNIAVSVTNEANYRSSNHAITQKELRIDRTTPSVSDLMLDFVRYGTWGREATYDSDNALTYFSVDPIYIYYSQTENRSDISYYFAFWTGGIGGLTLSYNPTGTIPFDATLVPNKWYSLPSSQRVAFPAPNVAGWNVNPLERPTYYLIFYAINEVGNADGGALDGVYRAYKFSVDPSVLDGRISFSIQGGAHYDESLGMYAYKYQTNAVINASVEGGSMLVKLQYKRDDENIWRDYLDVSDASVVAKINDVWDEYAAWVKNGSVGTSPLTKLYGMGTWRTPADIAAHPMNLGKAYCNLVLRSGIRTAISFRAVNEAGAVFYYDARQGRLFIVFDESVPDFSIALTIGKTGIPYNGGSSSSLSDKDGSWSNQEITIDLKVNNDVVSGVFVTYTLTFSLNGNPVTTDQREVPAMRFSTNVLDGFDQNGDMILTIYMYNKADVGNASLCSIQAVRLRVDQVSPVFHLMGEAYNNDGAKTPVASGDWTNRSNVRLVLSTDAKYKSVSPVTYRYEIRTLANSGVEAGDWEEGQDLIATADNGGVSTYTIIATNASGLRYTVVFQVNIDVTPPVIRFTGSIQVIEGMKHFIDLRVYIMGDHLDICEYICFKEDTRGFPLDPNGYIISTSSVNNSILTEKGTLENYRGYVRIYVRDLAGNEDSFEFYMLPFELDVNNVTLSREDLETVRKYESDLELARSYMDTARVVYFESLISRLKDRINTLENEIAARRAYLARLAQKTSFDLRSDYADMYEFAEAFKNYPLFGQGWIQDAITGDRGSVYYKYYDIFNTQFLILQGLMAKVADVENNAAKLPAINRVIASDYDEILRVYGAYNDLTPDQKSVFAPNLYTKLLAVKKKCEVLMLTDEDSGISLDGDFAPGAKIKVTEYTPDDDRFANVQRAVLKSTDTKAPQFVVSVHTISLTGASAQTSAGRVTIVLPIPVEYMNYVTFGVYVISDRGTVTRIDEVVISGDGRSVSFSIGGANASYGARYASLPNENVPFQNTTFALAIKAVIEDNSANADIYGTFLGIELDTTMIRNLIIAGAVLLAIIIVIVIIIGARQRRFLNSYNRAYRSSLYRKGVQGIPKGNTIPRTNLNDPDKRFVTPEKPYPKA